MIFRRDMLKLGAASIVASSFGQAFRARAFGSAQSFSNQAMVINHQVSDSAEVNGSGPSMDFPIAILWSIEPPFNRLFDNSPPRNGNLYVPKDMSIVALDTTNGNMLWETATIQAGAQIHQITDDLITVTSQHRVATGGLQVLDAASGVERWRLDAGGGGQNSPVLVDDVIYIGMSGDFMALDASTGAAIWTEPHAQGHAIDQNDSLLVVCQDYVHENGDVLSIDRLTGQENWRTERPNWQSIENPGNTILLLENNLLFCLADSTTVQAVDTRTGEAAWVYPAGQLFRLEVVLNGLVIVGSDTAVVALRAESGEEVWRFEPGGNPYVVQQNGNNILIEAGPVLYALDVETGATTWEFSTGEEEVFGQLRADDSSIFIAGQNLYGLDAGTGSEKMRYPLPIDPFYERARLVMGEGMLFLEYGSDQLFALGNVKTSTLGTDVVLRAAPSATSPERGTGSAGQEIESLGDQNERDGEIWVIATINGIEGWIPLDAVDTSTLPPEGEIEIIYTPQ